MVSIPNYSAFLGEHCETNTTGNLLKHAGLPLSEPMLYGLGEGLAFGVMDFKNMPAPFIGGRPRSEEITKNLSKRVGFQVEYRQTRSKKKSVGKRCQLYRFGTAGWRETRHVFSRTMLHRTRILLHITWRPMAMTTLTCGLLTQPNRGE